MSLMIAFPASDNRRPDVPPLITAHNFTLFILQNLLASPESQEAAPSPQRAESASAGVFHFCAAASRLLRLRHKDAQAHKIQERE